MHRLFLSPDALNQEQVRFPAEATHQLTRVLRLREGDEVWVLTGDGMEHRVHLTALSRNEAHGRIVESRPNHTEPALDLTLYPALLKGKNLEWVLQKGTELGVARFVPVVTARSVADDVPQRRDGKLARWERILQEAAEQSGRGRVPALEPPLTFKEALAHAARSLILLPWEEGGQALRNALPETTRPLALFIGPEGGFTVAEVDQARAAGARVVTLGPRILRAETASIAAVAAIMALRGEWS